MKKISHFLLLIIAVSAIAACDSGVGPSRPATDTNVEAEK